MFYRVLIGQTDNLLTRLRAGLLGQKDAVDLLASLRMDFAQQLPRGSSAGDPAKGRNAQDDTENPQQNPQQSQ
jgi:hypothetical protein